MADKNPPELQNEITALEKEIFRKKEELTKLRHQIPPEPVSDYTFHGPNDTPVKLSELFGDRDELLLIHNMGKGCPYCTLWADGFNGVLNHIENRTAFAVVSPDNTATQAQFAASRGWKFRLVSGKGNSFTEDMGFLSAKKSQQPGVSTFRKDESGNITRIAKTSFGPGDDYCFVWHLFDLLPNGINDWEPKFKY